MHKPLRLWLPRSLFAVLMVVAAVSGESASVHEDGKIDCGLNALYILHSLEGRQKTLREISEALPPLRRDGYSMAELAAASRSLGLKLEGFQLSRSKEVLERPAIVFLQQEASTGHFAVIRPVGTKGTMIQIIDPPYAPYIIDYERIYASKSWTGRILCASQWWNSFLTNGIAYFLLCSLFIFLMFVSWFKPREQVRSKLRKFSND